MAARAISEGRGRVQISKLSKSELYLDLLPLLNSGRVELLDHPRLLAQLGALERRTARGGRDTVDHPPASHDDLANAVAGVVVQTARHGGVTLDLSRILETNGHRQLADRLRPAGDEEWEEQEVPGSQSFAKVL